MPPRKEGTARVVVSSAWIETGDRIRRRIERHFVGQIGRGKVKNAIFPTTTTTRPEIAKEFGGPGASNPEGRSRRLRRPVGQYGEPEAQRETERRRRRRRRRRVITLFAGNSCQRYGGYGYGGDRLLRQLLPAATLSPYHVITVSGAVLQIVPQIYKSIALTDLQNLPRSLSDF